MLLEGLKLMGVGMTTVMLFLLLMIACIGLVARFTRKQSQLEEAALANQQVSARPPPPAKQAAVPVEVFAAAIAVYEEERKQLAAPI